MVYSRLVHCVVAFLILAGLVASACSKAPHAQSGPAAAPARDGEIGRSGVGLMRRPYVDASRPRGDGGGPRPLATTLWYPVDPGGQEMAIAVPPEQPLFLFGRAVPGAPMSESRARYPLVLLSHGTGGSAMQMMWLGSELAAHGFIVAALDHHGNTAAGGDYLPEGFVLWWERARDLRALLDRLLADESLAGRIDPARIAAAGFSLGGFTVLGLAGAITDREQFRRYCQSPQAEFTCQEPPEFPQLVEAFAARLESAPAEVAAWINESLADHGASQRDRRVRAVYAVAPALVAAITEQSLSAIEIPVHITVGTQDTIAPMVGNGQRAAEMIREAALTLIDGAGHYVFLSQCSELGQQRLPICQDPAEIDRAAVHREVSRSAVDFLRRVLGVERPTPG